VVREESYLVTFGAKAERVIIERARSEFDAAEASRPPVSQMACANDQKTRCVTCIECDRSPGDSSFLLELSELSLSGSSLAET